MKKKDILDMIECREDRVGFLHMSQHTEIRNLLDGKIDTNVSFLKLTDALMSMRDGNRKKVDKALEIVFEANDSFKTERYRYEFGKLYLYNEFESAYFFFSRVTKKELKFLIDKNGKYV